MNTYTFGAVHPPEVYTYGQLEILARHWHQEAQYWKGRALSGEQRMQEHDCDEVDA